MCLVLGIFEKFTQYLGGDIYYVVGDIVFRLKIKIRVVDINQGFFCLGINDVLQYMKGGELIMEYKYLRKGRKDKK